MMNPSYKQKPALFRQILSAILLGSAAVVVVALAWILGMYLLFAGKVLPGVSLNDTSLSGMNATQVEATISTTYTFPQTGHILLQAGDKNWMVSPAQLGSYLDLVGTTQNALAVGRSGTLFQSLKDLIQASFYGYEISPIFIFDQKTALQYLIDLSKSIDQPIKEASINVENTQVVITQGQPGRILDLAASLAAINGQLEKMQDGIVPLVIQENQPRMLDVSKQGELVRNILSQPFVLTLPDNSSGNSNWKIEPVELARLLTFTEVQNNNNTDLQIGINKALATAYLHTLEKDIDQNPQNARFTFNDDTRLLDLIQPSVQGRTLEIEPSVEAINQAIIQGKHTTDLVVNLTDPQIKDTTTGADLGITELVSSYTSYFRGSSDERVHNIQTAAARFHGLLIAPGATLSMSDELGNISLDNGYAEAPIIVGDQTIEGVGGGVCQVSTTLFRTAFFGGYPIVERYAHAYRVGYYEQTASGHNQQLAGLDATVFVPIVDFKFTNDTPYWLLMETYVSPTNDTLTWKFYSTSDGRSVDWNSTGPTDIVEPPDPLYREDDSLPSGTIKQVEYAVDGANVVVNRTVTRNGQVLYTDRFATNYEPWQAVYTYGPGTPNIPTSTPTP